MIGLVTEDDDANAACKDSFELQTPRIADIKPRQNAMENLPHIDGVVFQQQKAKDGAVYITATGNVRNKNSILKEAGFKWNASRKLWWKAA
jgi:IMP cyclohydrolase